MSRKRMIPGRRDAVLPAAIFWLLLVLAIGAGGARALSGLPLLAETLLPPELMAAQARNVDSVPDARVTLSERFPASAYTPQWLTPVSPHGYPAWLTLRMKTAQGGGAVATAAEAPGPGIAIVIDDLGDDVAAARRAIALPAAVSLSFLPYADATPTLARAALRAGHQVLVHVPMEPDGTQDPGPNALLTALPPVEIARRLDWALSRVPGHAGINNHEGSRFTADRVALVPVMETLSDRRIFFLDSRTTASSAVVPLARAFGVPSAARDVFLDDVPSAGAIAASLSLAEQVSRRDGVAIAIGHPKPTTLDALEAWCAHRGDLITAADAIRRKTAREMNAVAVR